MRKGAANAVACLLRPNREDVRVFSRTFDRSFNVTWLRDHCKCPQCVDASSGQKLRSSGSAATAGPPVSPPRVEGNTLIVPLREHEVHVPVTHLGVVVSGRVKNPGRMLPAAEERQRGLSFLSKPTLSFRRFISQPLARAWALRTLQASGLVLVEGIPKDAPSGTVVRLAERIAPVMPTFYGVHWDVQSVPGAANIAYTAQQLDWHQDLLYFESPPGVQLLHCLKQAPSGGETLFLDAVAAADSFEAKHPDDFVLLSRFQFTYQYANEQVALTQRRPLFAPATDKFSHRRVFWSPEWQGNLSLHKAVRRHYEAFAAWEKHLGEAPQLSLKLQPGTAVLFDNHRMLHARNAYAGERHLQGCYLSRDAFRTALSEEYVRNCDLEPFTVLEEKD